MVQLKLVSNLTSVSEGSKHSPLTPISWPSLPTVTTTPKESIEENLLYRETSEVGIGQLNRFFIKMHKTGHILQRDDIGEYVRLQVKNSELDLLRPIYLTGPFALYVDVTPHNYSHLKKFDEDIQYDSDLKPGQSFKAKLRLSEGSHIEGDLYGWSVDVVSQLALATAFHIRFDIAIGYDYALLKKVTEKHTPCGGINVKMSTSDELWDKPPQDPENPVHLVIITHGIFSNIGADMIYIKDRIEGIASHTPGSNIMIRGYKGNCGKSEKGIKYLGKRVGQFVMDTVEKSPYAIDRISFIGHSLGGPVQSYAIAYILWNKPDFFKNIIPINFVILASPMLGITEFPVAVSFALDVGMLGVTGRDLTLRHKFPSLMKKGKKHQDSASNHLTTKPILEQFLLPPAHAVFERFVSRTSYANAIHDGIVPLRTSALLYLDWRGLGDIKELRKKYNEDTNAVTELQQDREEDEDGSRPRRGTVGEIPKEKEGKGESKVIKEVAHEGSGAQLKTHSSERTPSPSGLHLLKTSTMKTSTMFSETKKKQKRKKLKKYLRTQTLKGESTDGINSKSSTPTGSSFDSPLPESSNIDSVGEEDDDELNLHVPPVASTILTAANVVMSSPPEQEYLRNPSSRPPSIFHDKTYTYADLPPAHYSKIRSKLSLTRDKKALQEQLARSWHKNMEWRKVLVTLKPDAHNNIAVRRRYVNAWGWGVIDHLVENHFGQEALEKELEAVRKTKDRTL